MTVADRVAYNKEWRAANREKVRERERKYFQDNKDKLKPYKVLSTIKDRALKKGLDFDLSLEDIENFSVCPVFGFPLKRSEGGKPSYDSPSVDRIDPSKGYTKDNIQIISNLANMMKQNATPEQLLLFAEWVFKTYKEQPCENTVD